MSLEIGGLIVVVVVVVCATFTKAAPVCAPNITQALTGFFALANFSLQV